MAVGAGDAAGARGHRHPLGVVGAFGLALLGQAAVAYVALSVVPGGTVYTFLGGLLGNVDRRGLRHLRHLGDDGRDQRRRVRRPRAPRSTGEPVADPDVTGILFVQLDGVPFPVLEWGVMGAPCPPCRGGSAAAATSSWSGPPRCRRRRPAADGEPARHNRRHPRLRLGRPATGRVFVANKPADAVDIEALHSDGQGLLADGGVR